MTDSKNSKPTAAESNSLASASSQEFEFDPIELSDFIIHYQNASFHLHSLILYKESKYFRAVITAQRADDEQACNKTIQCQQPNHRCVTLPDLIGGK